MYAALLTALVTWIAANFDLPRDYDHPQVQAGAGDGDHVLALPGLHARAAAGGAEFTPGETRTGSHRREVVAVYDDRTKTIFLPDTWTGETPADLSVLVHEMVHHLQNSAQMKYECPGAREQLAYAAQDKWLNLFGRDLSSEFELDAFTLKMTTACGF